MFLSSLDSSPFVLIDGFDEWGLVFGRGQGLICFAQSIDHYITYSIISAQPQLSYSSVVSTIRLFPVTSGENEGHTFVQWSGNFSSDADAGMLFWTVDKRSNTDE